MISPLRYRPMTSVNILFRCTTLVIPCTAPTDLILFSVNEGCNSVTCYYQKLTLATVDPHFSGLFGTWACSDNWNIWISEAHTFIYKTALKYFNKTHTFKNALIEQSKPSSDNHSNWIYEGWISEGPLYYYHQYAYLRNQELHYHWSFIFIAKLFSYKITAYWNTCVFHTGA